MSTRFSQTLVIAVALWMNSPWPMTVARAQEAKSTIAIKATTDRADAIYKVGETATFSIVVSLNNRPVEEGSVECVFSKDGVQPKAAQSLKLINGTATVQGKLSDPGFLLLRATFGKSTALVSAGFDPLQLKPSLPVPDDFDQFWSAQKSALAAIAVRATLTPVDSAMDNIESFDVQVDCLGAPVSGYFSRPRNAKPKSLPAILFVHGAGVRSASLGNASWALEEGGMLALDINAHGIPNGKPAEYYTQLSTGELKDYRSSGREDREKCYFKGMFSRLIRAIDFLAQQAEWDGKTMIVYGSSQGGFQAFAAGGLDLRVTFLCAGVPAGCDHTGASVGRVNGWPKLVPTDASGKPNTESERTARYFDCVNFATRAKCKGAAVTVGFIDTTCPPTSVYAAYNALGIPKSIHTDVLAGHTSTPAASRFMRQAAIEHIRDMK